MAWTQTPWNPKKAKAEAAALVAQLTDEQLALLAQQTYIGLGREIAAARRLIAARRPAPALSTRRSPLRGKEV
jgi:hypothetical protein